MMAAPCFNFSYFRLFVLRGESTKPWNILAFMTDVWRKHDILFLSRFRLLWGQKSKTRTPANHRRWLCHVFDFSLFAHHTKHENTITLSCYRLSSRHTQTLKVVGRKRERLKTWKQPSQRMSDFRISNLLPRRKREDTINRKRKDHNWIIVYFAIHLSFGLLSLINYWWCFSVEPISDIFSCSDFRRWTTTEKELCFCAIL